MTFGIIDIIVAVTVILSVLFALYRGLVRELLGITAWILAGFGALYCYVFLQPFVHRFVENETFSSIIAGAIISLVVLIFMTLLNAKITSRLRRSSLSGLDRLLGLLFGIFRALLLIAVVYMGASMFLPKKQLIKLEEKNVTMPYIQKLADVIRHFVPEEIREDFEEYGHDMKEESQKTKVIQKVAKPALEAVQKTRQEVTKKAIAPIREQIKDITDYKEDDRQSLDKMIEEVMEGMDE